jgi:hypothetical protein
LIVEALMDAPRIHRRLLRRVQRAQDRRWLRWQLIASIRSAIPPDRAHRLFRDLDAVGLPRVAIALAELHRELDAAAHALRRSED